MSDFIADKEMIAIWMKDFQNSNRSLDEEIDDIKGTISNERLVQKGSDSQERIEMHEQNIATLSEYLTELENIGKAESEE